MSRRLRWLARRYCKRSLVLARSEDSERILRQLEIPVEPGTDTAWTFEPHPPQIGEAKLREAGWDGRTPLLAVCPIHPFWWPVKASLLKAALRALFGSYGRAHYRSVYFHTGGAAVERAFRKYLAAIAGGIESFRSRRSVFPVLVAMEQLDTLACDRIATLLGNIPVFSSRNHDMYELISILRNAHLLLSSRYHAIVTTMPALIPSAGITMDERIRNLMRERGDDHLVLEAGDPDLEGKVDAVLERLWVQRAEVRSGIGRSVVRNLHRMAAMGAAFEREVGRRFPEFPTRSGIVSWEDYLPPLSPSLRHLIDEFGAQTPEISPFGIAVPASSA
jgi:polysaccharide pyruvyl transferase WcaK-like protein